MKRRLAAPWLFILLAAVLLAPLERPAWLGALDRLMFDFGTQPRQASGKVALIELEADAMDALRLGPAANPALHELIAVLVDTGSAVALLLPEPPALTVSVDSLMSVSSTDAGTGGEFARQWQRREGQWQRWLDTRRVLLGSAPAAVLNPSRKLPAADDPAAAWWRDLFSPSAPSLDSARKGSALPSLPVAPPAPIARPLFFHHGDERVPELAAALAGPDFAALHDALLAPRRSGELRRWSLEDASPTALAGATVLIGAKGDATLERSALALADYLESTAFEQPLWWEPMQRAILLGLLLLCLVLMPRVAVLSGLLVAGLVAVVLALVQLSWQWQRQQWLPMGVPIQFTLAGAVLCLDWGLRRRAWRELGAERDAMAMALSEHYLQEQRLEEARDALATCTTTGALLDSLYDIAAQQERRRQYRAAGRSYEAIVQRNPRFRDAAARARQLSEAAPELAAGTDLARTLALADTPAPPTLLGRYEIERELGRGAMGVVYLARDPRIGRRVALKTLNCGLLNTEERQSVKERFFREAEAAGRLSHPNIVTVFDVGEEAELAYIAMDFAPGRSLDHHTRVPELLPVPTVFAIVAQVAEALDYAHGQNIVHRDVKPGNIIYEADSGRARVTDFGIARLTDHARTRTGDILGSPLYMSPEQLRGEKVQGASDIYSLGVSFYQLLCGEPPFSSDSVAGVALEILNKKSRSVRAIRPELPGSAVRIINKAMHKSTAKRYASAAEMAAAVRRAAAREFGKEAVN